jgi:hypothetical protein
VSTGVGALGVEATVAGRQAPGSAILEQNRNPTTLFAKQTPSLAPLGTMRCNLGQPGDAISPPHQRPACSSGARPCPDHESAVQHACPGPLDSSGRQRPLDESDVCPGGYTMSNSPVISTLDRERTLQALEPEEWAVRNTYPTCGDWHVA